MIADVLNCWCHGRKDAGRTPEQGRHPNRALLQGRGQRFALPRGAHVVIIVADLSRLLPAPWRGMHVLQASLLTRECVWPSSSRIPKVHPYIDDRGRWDATVELWTVDFSDVAPH